MWHRQGCYLSLVRGSQYFIHEEQMEGPKVQSNLQEEQHYGRASSINQPLILGEIMMGSCSSKFLLLLYWINVAKVGSFLI